MFGIGFNEMLVILAIALIVLGPEKLPEIARSLGKALNQLKRATDDVTKSVMADTGLKETAESLKKSIMVDSGLKETADSLKKSLQVDTGLSRGELRKMFEDIEQGKPRPAAQPAAADSEGQPSSSVPEASASPAAETTESPAPKVPAAKFADDDTD